MLDILYDIMIPVELSPVIKTTLLLNSENIIFNCLIMVFFVRGFHS